MVNEGGDGIVGLEPLLALVSKGLSKGKLDVLVVVVIVVLELNLVVVDCVEVFFGLLGR